MRGRPDVPTTSIRIVWVPLDDQLRSNTTLRYPGSARYWLTVATSAPSMKTRALPRVGPTADTQAIARPVNVRASFAPAALA